MMCALCFGLHRYCLTSNDRGILILIHCPQLTGNLYLTNSVITSGFLNDKHPLQVPSCNQWLDSFESTKILHLHFCAQGMAEIHSPSNAAKNTDVGSKKGPQGKQKRSPKKIAKSSNVLVKFSRKQAMEEDHVFYFAYGSNMNPERMKERKVQYTSRVLGKLAGHRLVFNKASKDKTVAYANIAPDKTSTVYGTLYVCRPEGLDKLDKFEGVAGGQYYRAFVDVVSDDGQTCRAVTYIACSENCHEIEKPIPLWYLNHLLAGKDLLPTDHVAFLESHHSRTI